jgi:RHS repeat-associated protein
MNFTPRHIVLFLITFLCSAGSAFAQVQTGTPPFGSFTDGPDTINLANLNIHLNIPVLHKAGRGTNFNYDLTYDSSIWNPVAGGWGPTTNWGWTSQSALSSGNFGYLTYTQTTTLCYDGQGHPNGADQYISNSTYYDPWGKIHHFSGYIDAKSGGCGNTQVNTYPGYDGTGLTLQSPTGSILTTSGASISPPVNPTGVAYSSSYTDRNGNQVSSDGTGQIFDTLSSTTAVLTISGSNPLIFTYTAPSGAASYKMNFTNYTVATNFGVAGINEYRSSAAVPLVSSIQLPDGSQYSFNYEATPGTCIPYGTTTCVTARIKSVTFPTGGSITYSYSGGSNGIFPDGSTAGLKRYTPDTGSSAYWNYSRTLETGAASVTKVTDPTTQANQTLIQFQGLYETQRDAYSGSAPSFSTFPIPESTLQASNLLKEIQSCYNVHTSNCTSTAITAPITQRNITTQFPGASNKTSQQIFKYNSTGSLIEQDDYDFGNGAPGVLLEKTAITYASLPGISTFRQQVTVTNGSGATVSQINYNYGDTVTPTSGTPQHTTPAGSRGNLLSTNYYTHGSTFITKSFTYFDTGKIQTTTDVNGAQTTYAYGACGNSYPTSVTEPLNLSRSMSWNCTGGVQLQVTDENTRQATTAYSDPYFWRPASTTDPSNSVANITYVSPTRLESVLSIVSGSSAVDGLVTVDGLGRRQVSQARQTPGGSTFDSVETDYDIAGRPWRTTLPYSGTVGQLMSTGPASTLTYDVLGRIASATDSGGGTVTNSYSQNDVLVTRGPAPTGENTKQDQSEYDGLGRLTSVCEITSSTGSGSCAQANSKTGFWTKYTYDALGRLTGVTQNAQSGTTQSRSFVYDLLGRMTSEVQAESGTTTYTYDTDSTCGTSNGDLVKRVDSVGNVTCYAYDTLHRQTSITYPSGTYASKTPGKYFVYDTATVNSVAMANAKGRLAEAYTCVSPCSTKLTDIGFSYTVRGEPSDVYEKTPNSGTYYHVAEQYWSNGAMKQLNGLASLPTFTFNLDGKGRTYQVSASSGQNPVTNTVFNNGNLPTSVTFGSADSDSFTYDANTGRMTQYKFTINGQSLAGNLTWNANSTLQNQNITDALNSTDTQSCTYLYDDLMRIQSANCGSVWSQTFSYDAFGNISKSGSYSFQPTYNASTNRISSVGGFTPTYDLNGNTLTDPAHTYSWDSSGKPVAIDTVNMTYDALGRMAEQNRSGTYTQFVYGPHGGKFAIITGGTLQKAFIPLPGGGQAVYNASGLLYYGHSDHLGSVRLGSTSTRTVSFDVAYAPFGETYASVGSSDPAFTGQRQDTVSGLFDFPEREYNNQGRWSSPDPSGIAAFNLSDPQSLNRYAYVSNRPLNITDPTGLWGERKLVNKGGCNSCGGGSIGGGDSGNPFNGTDPGTGQAPSGGDPSNSGQSVCYTSADCPSGASLGQQQGNCDPTYCTETTTTDPGNPGSNPEVQTESAPITGDLSYDCGNCLLSAWQNDTQSQIILNSAGDWVTAGAAYTAVVGGTIATGGLLGEALADLPAVDVGIGPTEGVANPFHMTYGVDGTFQQGLLVNGQMQVTEGSFAEATFAEQPIQLSVPVLHPEAVLAPEGASVTNCVTGACAAIIRGWIGAP